MLMLVCVALKQSANIASGGTQRGGGGGAKMRQFAKDMRYRIMESEKTQKQRVRPLGDRVSPGWH